MAKPKWLKALVRWLVREALDELQKKLTSPAARRN